MFAVDPFVIEAKLSSQGKQITVKALLDSGSAAYSCIDPGVAKEACRKLDLVTTRMGEPQPIQDFQGNQADPIIQKILPTLAVGHSKTASAPMMMAKLGTYDCILGKPWMNQTQVIMDMADDSIHFLPDHLRKEWDQIKKKAFDWHEAKQLSPTLTLPTTGLTQICHRPSPDSSSESEPKEFRPTAIRRRKDSICVSILSNGLNQSLESSVPSVRKQRRLRYQRGLRARKQKSNDELRKAIQEPGKHPRTPPIAINRIGAAPYMTLLKDKKNHCFAMTPCEIKAAADEYLAGLSQEGPTIAGITLSPQEIRSKVPNYLHDLLDMFDKKRADRLPDFNGSEHKIELEGDQSLLPKSRAYPLSGPKLVEMTKYIEKHVLEGKIVPSKAPYSSPILFAEKADGSLRLCVDYRRLNALTKKNGYRLPLIDEVLAQVMGCKYLTKLDIVAAFNNLRMHPDSVDLTTFATSMGNYKYLVMPFGLTNGPATWQQYINGILFEYLNKFCQVYVDDVLIYSKTLKEHRAHVRAVLEKLQAAGLQVDPTKSEFEVQETKFLGVILSTEGLRMDPEKVQAVTDWATPTKIKQVQGFLGFCNFYRRFIKGFASIAKPLVNLTRKDVPFYWSDACEQAFAHMKETVTKAPILKHYDRSKTTVLFTDSSDYVNGAVLSQYDDEGQLHPVAYYSKNLNPAECNYNIYDKELNALIKALEHWNAELENTEIPIQVFTDHKNLTYWQTAKALSARQVRIFQKFANYNFKIIHVAGSKNIQADALTRMAGREPEHANDIRLSQREQIILPKSSFQTIAPLTAEDPIHERIKVTNCEAEECTLIRQAKREERKNLGYLQMDRCEVIDGALFVNNRLYVPTEHVPELLGHVHNQPSCSHPGINRSLELLQRWYYWPSMKEDIRRFNANCHRCHRAKASNDTKHGLLHPNSIPEQRWKDIALDFITGLPKSENYDAILTVVDRLSKERHYIPCTAEEEGTSAEETAWLLITWVFRLHGLPDTVISDRGPQFVSTVWKALCTRLKIDTRLSTAFHPETDGQTERANQDVERHLRLFCNQYQDDWSTWIPVAEFADNNAVSASTGMSPFFVNKGYHPRMSFSPNNTTYETVRQRILAAKADSISDQMEEINKKAQENMAKAQTQMVHQANKHRQDITFEVGDMVYLSTKNLKTDRPSKKLDHKRIGPYQVLARHGESYKVDLPASVKIHDVFHPSLLSKASADPLPGQENEPSPPIVVDQHEEWFLDGIIDSRYHYNRLQYKVKWEGFDEDITWYNADGEEFANAQEAIQDFHAAYPQAAGPAITKRKQRRIRG